MRTSDRSSATPSDVAEPCGTAPSTGHTLPSWVLVVPLRVFLAVGWIRAAAEKLINDRWWDGHGLRSFLTTDRAMALPFMRPLMDGVFQHQAIAIAAVVAVVELACGVAIALGRCMRLALWSAVVLNVVFILCGRVNPSAFYLVMEIALLLALAEGAIGSFVGRRNDRAALLFSAAAGAFGVAMMPFIRTLEPADVIADPAAMLAFLGVLVAGANTVRWALRRPAGTTAHAVARRCVAWTNARPRRAERALERAALPSMGAPVLPSSAAGPAVDAPAPAAIHLAVERALP